MKRQLLEAARIIILAIAVLTSVAGVAEARTSTATNRSCYFVPPYYVGACVDTPDCQNMCDPYWPGQGVGACLGEPLCCVCE